MMSNVQSNIIYVTLNTNNVQGLSSGKIIRLRPQVK